MSRESTPSVVSSGYLDSEYESDTFSSAHEAAEQEPPPAPARGNLLSYVLDKSLLLLPLSVSILLRSFGSSEFRASALAWLLIIPMTSDVSIDEAVFPALVTSSLRFDNGIVELNMFLPIARSRLGLFTMAMLSFYKETPKFLVCGIVQRTLIRFAASLLNNSAPKSELSLLCCAASNVVYHAVADGLRWSDPSAVLLCGLLGALPTYPLFRKFCATYRASLGRNRAQQWRLAALIYAVYFGCAGYLFFGLLLPHASDLWLAMRENADLFMHWALVLLFSAAVARLLGPRLGLDGRRKLWHVATVLMFLPSSVRERPFTKLALGAAVVLFIGLEAIRATALPPLGEPLHRALQSFIDHRDRRGPVVISHIYLLLGIAVPIFLRQSPAGLICLGFGDTSASQIGRRYGRWRLFGEKSLEGCIAFALATGAVMAYTTETPDLLWVVIPTALLEAVSPLNDNLVVPMYMLALQSLVSE